MPLPLPRLALTSLLTAIARCRPRRWHQIEAMGEEAIAVRADVSKPADVDRLVTQTVDTMGKVDILFNNAGIIRLHRWKSTATRYGSEPSTSILQATSSVAVGSSLR